MALANGVLVHGPNSWGCAVRLPDGRLKVLADYKRYRASSVTNPLLRGPARLAEVIALVPQVRRRMPEAKLPFERPRVLTAMVASAAAVQVARGSASGCHPPRRSSSAPWPRSSRRCSLCGATISPRTTAPSTSRSAATSTGRPARRSTSAAARTCSARSSRLSPSATCSPHAPRFICARPARALASLGAVAASTEIFSWMVRHPENRVAKALARPGHEIQHRLATAEPTPEQLEVAEAALAACLELEHGSQD